MRFKKFLQKEFLREEELARISSVGKLRRVRNMDETFDPYDNSDLEHSDDFLSDADYARLSRYVRKNYPHYNLSALGPGKRVGELNAQIMPQDGRGGTIDLKVNFHGNKMDVREGTFLNSLNQLNEQTQLTAAHVPKIMALVDRWGKGDLDYDEMPSWIHDLMYDAFHQDMPYGTQTGDDSTPDEWFHDQDPAELADDFERWLMAKAQAGYKVHHTNQHKFMQDRMNPPPDEL